MSKEDGAAFIFSPHSNGRDAAYVIRAFEHFRSGCEGYGKPYVVLEEHGGFDVRCLAPMQKEQKRAFEGTCLVERKDGKVVLKRSSTGKRITLPEAAYENMTEFADLDMSTYGGIKRAFELCRESERRGFSEPSSDGFNGFSCYLRKSKIPSVKENIDFDLYWEHEVVMVKDETDMIKRYCTGDYDGFRKKCLAVQRRSADINCRRNRDIIRQVQDLASGRFVIAQFGTCHLPVYEHLSKTLPSKAAVAPLVILDAHELLYRRDRNLLEGTNEDVSALEERAVITYIPAGFMDLMNEHDVEKGRACQRVLERVTEKTSRDLSKFFSSVLSPSLKEKGFDFRNEALRWLLSEGVMTAEEFGYITKSSLVPNELPI